MPPTLSFPLQATPRHPWRPMTDGEWAALRPLVAPDAARGGRPAADRRRSWDAIFWVACSRGPWRELPPELGRADTAHRALRRAAHARLLDRLLLALRHPLAAAGPGLAALEWRILRAWRRAARLMPMSSLALARRLGLLSALPCAPRHLPQPGLSEMLNHLADQVLSPVLRSPGLLRWLKHLHRLAGGNRRAWRTTD